eukprot:5644715-Pleurochrysis_carterae.AAC.2
MQVSRERRCTRAEAEAGQTPQTMRGRTCKVGCPRERRRGEKWGKTKAAGHRLQRFLSACERMRKRDGTVSEAARLSKDEYRPSNRVT